MRLATLLACVLCLGCESVPPIAYVRLTEARQLTAQLETQLARSADAMNRAVLADSDERARTFVAEARREDRALERDLAKLESLVQSLAYEEEGARLKTFRVAFTHYLAVQNESSELARENTNRQAQRLSFGPAHAAVERFHAALGRVSVQAAYALRSIEALEMPHVVERDEARMSELEQQMSTLEAEVRAELAAVQHAPEADAALAEFLAVHAKILALSRRNTNVRALSLALGEGRAATSACEGALRELSEQLRARTFPATR
ncbi:MAG TPA: hypothetical protein VI299_00740 [Polyangiales bacterium]